MRGVLLSLILTIAVAFVGLAGVPDGMQGLVQLVFFSLLVVFVVLTVRYLARDR